MPLTRRSPAADPLAAARLTALIDGGRGWVPPRATLPRAAPPVAVVPVAGRSGHRDGGQGPPADAGPEQDRASDPGRERAQPGAPPGRPTGPVRHASTARWHRGRLDPGPRGVAALALVAVLAAAFAGIVVLRARPHEVTPPPALTRGAPAAGPRAAARPLPDPLTSAGVSGTGVPAADVVVSVTGTVVHPGLVRLPVGSRVDDAVRAAGGALSGGDLTGLNLARKLLDGEQVAVGVPSPGAAPATGVGPVPGRGQVPGALVDLNTAGLAELDGLPGIGPVLAQHLLDWRSQHGRFGSVDQLREVSGIGESTYTHLKDRVRV